MDKFSIFLIILYIITILIFVYLYRNYNCINKNWTDYKKIIINNNKNDKKTYIYTNDTINQDINDNIDNLSKIINK